MFGGSRRIFSTPRLVELGTGILEVDALTGKARFNGTSIQPLAIAAELRARLEGDLAEHGIPKSRVREATVRVEFSFDLIPWDQRATTSHLLVHGEPVKSGPMHRCAVTCTSVLRTDEAEYRGKYQFVEEWPLGWPAA
jgi:hypothetical protein